MPSSTWSPGCRYLGGLKPRPTPLGVPVLIGASRKSSIAKMSAGEDADHRLPGSLALGMAALRQGAQMLRVHDVAETQQAVKIEMEMMRHL